MSIEINKACFEDYEDIIKIVEQVQQLHVQLRPDLYQQYHDIITKSNFKNMVEDECCFVAKDENQIVGVIIIQYRNDDNPVKVKRHVIYIDTLVVDENYRNQGIGHQLLNYVKKLKKEKKMDSIELQVNAKNNRAYKMYQKYGFTMKTYTMELLDE